MIKLAGRSGLPLSREHNLSLYPGDMIARLLKLKHDFVSVLTVWLALSLAGAAGSLVPDRAASAVAASALFVAMLMIYSQFGSGRRSNVASFMMGGLALLPLSFAMLFLADNTEFDLFWVTLGGHVGYYPRGGMDFGLLVAGFIWWQSIMGLILISQVPGILRLVARK